MPVPPAARGSSARGTAGRIVAFAGLFAIFVAGASLVVGDAWQDTGSGLLAGSVITLVAAALSGGILIRRLDARPARAIGWPFTRRAGRDAVIGLGIGVLSIGAAALLMRTAGVLHYEAEPGTPGEWASALGRGFLLLGVGAASEEVLFRGYPFQVLARATGPVAATVVASLIFALGHAANPHVSILGMANIFLAGVMLSVAYLRTRNLWLAVGVHIGWNWGMASLLDLPVSGLDFLETPRYEPVLGRAAWLTGGAFGPEGGLAATLGFAIALAAVLKLPGLDEAPAMRALRPLLDPDETAGT
jgi:CAAX protease family protein